MTVVNVGAANIASLIAAEYRVVAIGDGRDTTSASQTTMNHFITKKIGQTPTIVGSTLIYNVDFAGSDIPASGVSEIGIFKTGTGESNGTTPPNGILLSRVTFTSTGTVAASDTVSFTNRIEVDGQ